MKDLTFWLFAALVTISVIGIGAKPVDEHDKGDALKSGPNRSHALLEAVKKIEEEGRLSHSFNPEEITKALGPFHSNIKFDEVFVDILSAVRKKVLNIRQARGFVQRMTELSDGFAFCPYFKMFRIILEVYDLCENINPSGSEDDSLSLLGDVFRMFLLQYTGIKCDTILTEELAPMMLELIRISDDNVVTAAKQIVTYMLRWDYVESEIKKFFVKDEPNRIMGSTDTFLMNVMSSPE